MSFLRSTTILVGATMAFTATGLFAFATPAMADGTTPDGFTYTTSGSSATITDYTPGTLDVTIPNEIIEGGTPYAVTDIAANAFDTKGLTSVTIPNSVTSIGNAAFRDNDLTTVTIPDSVTDIRNSVFENNDLTTATIGNSVTNIRNSAFDSNALTSFTIPDSVTDIGSYVFRDNALTTVTLGNSVTTIGEGAFSKNDLTTVTIPDFVNTIGDYAFQANDLTTVTIPDSVTTIGTDAFKANSNLESAVFNGDAPSMGSEVFGPAAPGFIVYYYEGATGFSDPWTSDNYPTQMISAAGSTLVLTPSGSVLADGTSTFTATVTVMDGNPGSAVADFPATFALPAGVSAPANTCVTDSTGVCAITLTSTTAGTYTIGVLAGNLTADATFSALPELAATGADISPVPYIAGGAVLLLGIFFTTFAIRRRKALR